jgi:hypothetical protein
LAMLFMCLLPTHQWSCVPAAWGSSSSSSKDTKQAVRQCGRRPSVLLDLLLHGAEIEAM